MFYVLYFIMWCIDIGVGATYIDAQIGFYAVKITKNIYNAIICRCFFIKM